MHWHISADSGEPLQPHDLWKAWHFEPALLIPLTVLIMIYGWGLYNLWHRNSVGHGIPVRDAYRFLAGTLALLVALVSPLDALAVVLFSAHMVQHLVLVLVAAPLLVTSSFPVALFWALPQRWAHTLGRSWNRSRPLTNTWKMISNPLFAWLFFTLTMWGWHMPSLYEAALQQEAFHYLEHLVFMSSAMLFWWVLFRYTGLKHLHYGMAVIYLFTTTLQSGILGALMTFAERPWYSYYTSLVAPWGLTPLQDQQLAGIIMWLPGGAFFTILTIIYFAAWLRVLEERSLLKQPHRTATPQKSE